jgi:hypothetical protein
LKFVRGKRPLPASGFLTFTMKLIMNNVVYIGVYLFVESRPWFAGVGPLDVVAIFYQS